MTHQSPRDLGELEAETAVAPECRSNPGDGMPDLSEAAPAGPWRRWAARCFDLYCEIFFVEVLFGIFRPPVKLPLLLLPIFVTILALLLDCAVYAACGNTPGKRLFGIKIVDDDTRVIGAGRYFHRNLLFCLCGIGFNIRFVNLLCAIIQYCLVSRGKPTTYDEVLKLTSLHCRTGKTGVVAGSALLAVFILLSAILRAKAHLG